MKRFLKQPGGVGQYDAVRVEWHPGHPPELKVMDGNAVVKTIDLSTYKYDGLHTLFQSHFQRHATATAPAPVGGTLISNLRSRRHGAGHKQQRAHHQQRRLSSPARRTAT